MKKLLYILVIFPMLVIGQSSGHTNNQKEEVSNAKEVTKKVLPANAIAANFNSKVIVAYANQGEQLIADFYDYMYFI